MPVVIAVVHVLRKHSAYYFSSKCLRRIGYFLFSLFNLVLILPTFLTYLVPCPLDLSFFIFSFPLFSAIVLLLISWFLVFLSIYLFSLFTFFAVSTRSLWRSCFPLFFLSAIVLVSLSIFCPFSMASSPALDLSASGLPDSPVRFPPPYSVE